MKERVHYLSLASVVSAFAVIMIHTNGCFWKFSTDSYWIEAVFIEYITRFAVPVFFMISGATLIDYSDRYTTKEYFQKRVQKALIPFVVWSLFGLGYRLVMGTYKIELSFSGVMKVFYDLLNTKVIFIYWFFITLFGLYLCVPLFSAIRKEIRLKVCTYLLIVSLILNYIVPFVCEMLEVQMERVVPFEVAQNYIIFALIGYVVSKKEIPSWVNKILYVLGVAGFVFLFSRTYAFSMEAGKTIEAYKGYDNFPCLLYATGVFVFFKEIGTKIRNEKLIQCIEILSGYTFAIYLLHYYFIDLLEGVFGNELSLVYRIVAPVINFGICILVTYLLRKIPLIRKVLP